MNNKKKVLSLSTILSVLFVCGMYSLVPRMLMTPVRSETNLAPENLNLNFEEFDIKTEDGISLSGNWIKSNVVSSNSIVILLHGIGGCKEHMLPIAKEMSKHGIETVLIDGRAHGQSEGKYCTYGYKESNDMRELVKYIKSISPDKKLGIYGHSLGGAVALQTIQKENQLDFGIIESTFAELDDIVADYQKRNSFGISVRSLCDYALQRAGKIENFKPDEVKPYLAAKEISIPMIISHGSSDTHIDPSYSEKIFNELQSENKQLIIVPDLKHESLFKDEDYKNKILEFVKSHS